jgi:hypothetical protein
MMRWLAWAGVAGVAVYVAIDVALAFLRPDYSLLERIFLGLELLWLLLVGLRLARGPAFRPAADLAG